MKAEANPSAQMVNAASIQVFAEQPRRYFDPDKQEQLVASIRKHGILEPLIVRPLDGAIYELVAGERRYRAAKEIGLEKIPVIVRELDNDTAFELALLENLQRDDLNPIEETEGILKLLSQSLGLEKDEIISLLNRAANAQRRGQLLTDNVKRQVKIADELFKAVGRLSRESFRTNRLPLLNLPSDVLDVLRQGRLEYTKGKAISRVTDVTKRGQLMQQAIDEQLSLSELKQRIKQLQSHSSEDENSSRLYDELYGEFKAVLRPNSQAWQNPEKCKKLKGLLAEIKAILEA